MEMILLDWTRMGHCYCLAGVVTQERPVRVVRPMPLRHRNATAANVGWSPFLLDGHCRWEVFELVGPEPARAEAPHLEDVWVRALRPRRRLATPEQRRAILTATRAETGPALFGVPLTLTRTSASVAAGTGQRSLTTVFVASGSISFAAHYREGHQEPEVRVKLPLPDLGERILPVKDHHLLFGADHEADNLDRLVDAMHTRIRRMGETVAIRLGLSRPFQGDVTRGSSTCWLMADGFFSLADPQP